MTAQSPVKTRQKQHCQIVGVIATGADLEMAVNMSEPPDLFELRLDHLLPIQDELEQKIATLRAPFIATARHPAEGGANSLSGTRRRELLSRFLPYARYVDVELRSAESFHPLLSSPPFRSVERILSLHDFDSTPTPRSLHAKARNAKSLGAAIFKVATRTDTAAQLARLLEFISHDEADLAVSVMGVGLLGTVSRVVLAGCGSIMAYAALADKQVEGQLSVEQLQGAFRILGFR
jgi:3-dehydroquinate dehydratase type I